MPASNVSTCCEGQGTRALGSLPEYVFSFGNNNTNKKKKKNKKSSDRKSDGASLFSSSAQTVSVNLWTPATLDLSSLQSNPSSTRSEAVMPFNALRINSSWPYAYPRLNVVRACVRMYT